MPKREQDQDRINTGGGDQNKGRAGGKVPSPPKDKCCQRHKHRADQHVQPNAFPVRPCLRQKAERFDAVIDPAEIAGVALSYQE